MYTKHLKAFALAAAVATTAIYPGLARAADIQLSFAFLDSAGGRFSEATAVSDNGRIAGWAQPDWGVAGRAVAWEPNFTAVGASSSRGNAINSAGQVAGVTYSGYSGAHATVWKDGVARDLHAQGHYRSEARAINEAGMVAGWSMANNLPNAMVWDAATGQQTSLSDVESEAYAINHAGQVAGWVNVGGYMHATLWSGTQAIDLGQSGEGSVAFGINDVGQAVGMSWSRDWPTNKALLWNGTVATELASLGNSSYALDINNHGSIVGHSRARETNAQHAALWIGSDIIDLNAFLSPELIAAGWVLTNATSINDQGWIVGIAENSNQGDLLRSGFVLSPVPEASSWGMAAMGGLVLMTLLRARRTRKATTSAGTTV